MSGRRLIRVVAPHFVAGFITDGTVRRTAPILRYITGWPDDRARKYFTSKGWTASVVAPTPGTAQETARASGVEVREVKP